MWWEKVVKKLWKEFILIEYFWNAKFGVRLINLTQIYYDWCSLFVSVIPALHASLSLSLLFSTILIILRLFLFCFNRTNIRNIFSTHYSSFSLFPFLVSFASLHAYSFGLKASHFHLLGTRAPLWFLWLQNILS